MKRIYGWFGGGKWGLCTSKKEALAYQKQHGGQVRYMSWGGYKAGKAWDAPTFQVMSDLLVG